MLEGVLELAFGVAALDRLERRREGRSHRGEGGGDRRDRARQIGQAGDAFRGVFDLGEVVLERRRQLVERRPRLLPRLGLGRTQGPQVVDELPSRSADIESEIGRASCRERVSFLV